MAGITDFEREVGLLLKEIEAECEKLEAREQQVKEALESAYQKRDTLQGALAVYRDHYRLPTSQVLVDEVLRQKLVGKTIKEMILTVALESQPPIFRVVDMNRKLVQAGMFKDEVAARDSVYSTLGRNTKTFIKLSKGQYMVNPERVVVAQVSFADQQGNGNQGEDSLRKRVVAILRDHPDWSRRQTVEELQKQGWNFGGKKPIFAVGMCYASIKKQSKLDTKVEPVLLHSVS